MLDPKRTAILLIGYQNDYFSPDGILYKVVEESLKSSDTLCNTLNLIEKIKNTNTLIVSTPIVFLEDYSELVNPIGILNTIKDVQAFKKGTKGSKTIPEILALGDRVIEVPGKRGLNAYVNTTLLETLNKNGITDVVIAGVVTSICIDSTARSSFEHGFQVHVLSDCTSGRTLFEQEFYCKEIFPLYAKVLTSIELCQQLKI